jgi:hypothetical protein
MDIHHPHRERNNVLKNRFNNNRGKNIETINTATGSEAKTFSGTHGGVEGIEFFFFLIILVIVIVTIARLKPILYRLNYEPL